MINLYPSGCIVFRFIYKYGIISDFIIKKGCKSYEIQNISKIILNKNYLFYLSKQSKNGDTYCKKVYENDYPPQEPNLCLI